MEHIRVHINDVDDEGRGRGLYTNPAGQTFKIAVRGAFSGDDVLVKIERVFPAMMLKVGKTLKFFNRGPCHTERTCPYQGPCPACPLHGSIPNLELDIKTSRIKHALNNASLSYNLEELVHHKSSVGYRQKVKLIAHVLDKQLRLGVYVPYSHRFVIAEQCPYVDTRINTAINIFLSQINQLNNLKDLNSIKAVIMRLGKDGVSAIIVSNKILSKNIFLNLEILVKQKHLLSVAERIQDNQTNSILGGETKRQLGPLLIESLEGGPLVDPDSFCQSDPEQAILMYELVADFLSQEDPTGLFIDAYAGTGGFSRGLLGRNCRNIIAIEQSPTALLSLNQLGVQVMLKPMSLALKDLIKLGPYAGIVVDPPKKGLMDDAQAIADLKANRLVLVSCDPDSMAKDLTVLLNNGYFVKKIIPIDFFGGTPAIETVVFLQSTAH